ncbi:MAG: outer membrane protein transport protein, partial [Acidobacteriota bacterium]
LRYSLLQLDALQETRLDYLSDLELDQLSPGASLEEVLALGIIDQRITAEIYDNQAHDITFNVGLLFNPDGKWSFGLVYKDGGDYEIDGREELTDCLIAAPMGATGCEPQTRNPAVTRITVPDFLGLGVAWRPFDRFRAALDINHITYSDLTFEPATNPDVTQAVRDQFEDVDDAVEVHFGLEYIFLLGSRKQPLTLRAGTYTDPDHDGFREIDSDDTVFTAGIGTVLMESFQIDLAAQWGDSVDAGILSLVYRF